MKTKGLYTLLNTEADRILSSSTFKLSRINYNTI